MSGELEAIVSSIHSCLLDTDLRIKELEVERAGLEAWHRGEAARLEYHCQGVLQRLNAARETLSAQLKDSASTAGLALASREQYLLAVSRGLAPELTSIQQLMDGAWEGGAQQFSVASCRARLASLLIPPPPSLPAHLPTFHPSSFLTKLRAPELGFLQLAEFLPSHFSLHLASPLPSLVVGARAVCYIVTSRQFTDAIQANIKFSVRNQESQEAVPFCREDCLVSADLRSFQLAFLLQQPGLYTVTVLLYDQPIQDSPLSLRLSPPPPGPSSPFSPAWNQVRSQLQQLTLTPRHQPPLQPNKEHIFLQPLQENLLHPIQAHLLHPVQEHFLQHFQENLLQPFPEHLVRPVPEHPLQPAQEHLRQPVQEFLLQPTQERLTQSSQEDFLQPVQGPLVLPSQQEQSVVPQPHLQQSSFRTSLSPISSGGDTGCLVLPPQHEAEVQCSCSCPAVLQGGTRQKVLETEGKVVAERREEDQGGEKSDPAEDIAESGEVGLEQKLVEREASEERYSSAATEPQDVRLLAGVARPLRRTRYTSLPPLPPLPPLARPSLVSLLALQSVRPSPPLARVDFLSLLPGPSPSLSRVTLCLAAPHFSSHLPNTVAKPIGICLLRDKCIVVASTFENKVKMFTGCGQLLREVQSPFHRPSDMVALSKGGFAVRDSTAIRCFDNSGKFQLSLDSFFLERIHGLAEDEEGRLVTINENRGREGREGGTRPGETDLLYFSLASGQLVRRVELVDVIDRAASKCRFLTAGRGTLVITDLGMDRVYVLHSVTKAVTVFGRSGSGPGCFSDPAGLAVDSAGNMLVADSRNHRLCLHDPRGGFLKEVKLEPTARRPSGLLVDPENGDLYVLNLHGEKAVVRYSLQAATYR